MVEARRLRGAGHMAAGLAILAAWLCPLRAATAKTQVHLATLTASCAVDAEIPQAIRNAAEGAALGLFGRVVAGDTAGAHDALSDEAQSVIPRDSFDQTVRTAHQLGPFDTGMVRHAYLIEASGPGPLPKMGCGKSPKDPDHVELSMRALPQQVHVQIVAHTPGNDWSVFVWLVPQQQSWKALSIDFALSSLGGRTSRDLQRLAREQSGRGHPLNAALLYQAAEGVSDRGPNAVFDWKKGLDQDVRSFSEPAEFTGDGPYGWSLGGKTYQVEAAYLTVSQEGLAVVLNRRLDPWPGEAAADADNRDFGDALLKLHPEFYDGFTAVIVKAIKPDDTVGLTSSFELGAK
jgi:hypothetical protein